MLDEQFETILRRQLPFLSDDEDLGADTRLRDLGLDSLATVGLLSVLERTYEIRFTDEALSMENFATPGLLWSVLSGLRSSGSAAATRP
jgi:acyl carrier protein